MQLTFKIIKDAWTRVKTEKAAEIMKAIPALVHPDKIYIKNRSDDPMSLTISFQGFEQAVQDQSQTPLVKNKILSWLRQFADDVQMVRGENDILLVKVSKTTNKMMPPKIHKAVTQVAPQYQQKADNVAKKLTNIIRKKTVNEGDIIQFPRKTQDEKNKEVIDDVFSVLGDYPIPPEKWIEDLILCASNDEVIHTRYIAPLLKRMKMMNKVDIKNSYVINMSWIEAVKAMATKYRKQFGHAFTDNDIKIAAQRLKNYFLKDLEDY